MRTDARPPWTARARIAEEVETSERGASLIMALVFVLVIGLLAAVLVGFAYTGSKSTLAFRRDRVVRYNVESALNMTITRLVHTPTIGVSESGTPSCTLIFRTVEPSGVTGPPVFQSNARFEVRCFPTPGIPSGARNADGGQGARDVTIEVVCNNARTTGTGRNERLMCGGGSTPANVVYGRARVRFEVDPEVADIQQRAVVPKIISWNTSSGA